MSDCDGDCRYQEGWDDGNDSGRASGYDDGKEDGFDEGYYVAKDKFRELIGMYINQNGRGQQKLLLRNLLSDMEKIEND